MFNSARTPSDVVKRLSDLANDVVRSPGMSQSKTALVLAGGGSFGAIQAGMLHSLATHGIAADMVVGSSVGSLNGAYYAGNPTLEGIERLETIWRGLRRSDVFPVSWAAVLGLLVGGLFLAYGYVRTRSLWLPVGLHIGWNFFEGVVFGFPVSGLDIYPLLRIKVNGPVLWTGGAFGPEAGLIVLPALILGAALIYFYTQNRNVNL